MMTATDELRRILDERGIEYETDDTQVSETEWYYVTKLRDGYRDRWIYEEPPECDLLVSYQYDLGAEEAIAATLGPCSDSCNCTNSERTSDERGTCHMETDDSCQNWNSCSECGADYYTDQPINFCPNCGRKVVDDA